MADVSPQILADVRKAFTRRIKADKRLERINNRIRDGTATISDAHDYAEIIGDALSDSFAEVLQPGVLPDDRMYYNIAKKVIEPTMRDNFKLATEKAAEIQKIVYLADGFGINPVEAVYPEARVRGLVDKVSEADTLAKVIDWLSDPVVNTTISFYDDWTIANADFQKGLGLKPKIRRELGSAELRRSRKRSYFIPCEWCQNLAGEYDYGDTPDDFFRRHEGCRCKITLERPGSYVRAGGWGRAIWQPDAATLEMRKVAGL